MAPGVFLVWSGVDPERSERPEHESSDDERSEDGDEQSENTIDVEPFVDSITSLPGVSRGGRYELSDGQPTLPPFSYDVPFLTVYELPDAKYHEETAFKKLQEQCLPGDEDGFEPRVYEEVERVENKGCEGVHPAIGEMVGICLCESPPTDSGDDFFIFHREVFAPLLSENPNFLRMRIFKMVGETGGKRATMPASPLMFIYEWVGDEMPWNELTAAAQEEGWRTHIEGGLTWQAVLYHPTRYSETKEPEKDSKGIQKDGVESSETSSK